MSVLSNNIYIYMCMFVHGLLTFFSPHVHKIKFYHFDIFPREAGLTEHPGNHEKLALTEY